MDVTETLEKIPPVGDFSQFVGQEHLKARLEVHLQSALARTQPMPHILLSGPAGTGKSTLAKLIADRQGLGEDFYKIVMPVDRRTLIRSLQMPAFNGGILFLDEIHALPKKDQEILLPVLSEGVVYDMRGRRFQMPWLTVVAATTERDMLIRPLHDRFPVKPEFAPYTDDELGQIVIGMAARMGIPLDEETARTLGTASGGTPRNAEEFILAARDLMVMNRGEPVTAERILGVCAVGRDGLTDQHRRYLTILSEQGGRAGSKTIELLLQVPQSTMRDLERLLLNRKLIELMPSGRELTPLGAMRLQGESANREVRSFPRR